MSRPAHLLHCAAADAVYAVPAYRSHNDATIEMLTFEWIRVLLRQQNGTASLPLPTICGSALETANLHVSDKATVWLVNCAKKRVH